MQTFNSGLWKRKKSSNIIRWRNVRKLGTTFGIDLNIKNGTLFVLKYEGNGACCEGSDRYYSINLHQLKFWREMK